MVELNGVPQAMGVHAKPTDALPPLDDDGPPEDELLPPLDELTPPEDEDSEPSSVDEDVFPLEDPPLEDEGSVGEASLSAYWPVIVEVHARRSAAAEAGTMTVANREVCVMYYIGARLVPWPRIRSR